jgi:hypothetical protein
VQLEAVAEDLRADEKVKGALAIALAAAPVLAAAGAEEEGQWRCLIWHKTDPILLL